jgi:hypothetical protein
MVQSTCSFSQTLQNYAAPCIMAMPYLRHWSCWSLAVEACIQSQWHPCGRWRKCGTWTRFFLCVFNSLATQLNAHYVTHQTGIWRVHNKGHNRLSPTPIIYCSENHTVWLVYLMSGTKGTIYQSPLNKKLILNHQPHFRRWYNKYTRPQ